jgi:predicted PurR-regulated permease PerM
VVGLTFVAFVAGLLITFRSIIGPLLLAFILAYLLHPVAAFIHRTTKLNWRWAVNLVFLIFVLIVLGLLTVLGFAVVDQLQSLIVIINTFSENLPNLVQQLSAQVLVFGPFRLEFNQFDLPALANQLLGILQPILGQFGTLVSTFATSALAIIGWALFIIVIAYFLLAQTGRVTDQLIHLEIPGHNADIQRLGQELSRVWNVFLRGQLAIFILAIILYTILLTALGVRYSLGIAILAGLARFIPYVGPAIVWIVIAMVSLLQGHNYFGLQPWVFTLLVIGLSVLLDQILDNVVVPRFHGQTLGVHPAAVLVAALVAAKLIGFVGLILAAPVLASMALLSRYILRKMFDLDPWPENAPSSRPPEFPWMEISKRSREWWNKLNRQNPG